MEENQQEILVQESIPTELIEIPIEIHSELDKKIVDAFLIFDHADNKTVEVREIGTVLRSLGFCPTEDEIQEVINATVSHDISGSIHLGKFLPYIAPLLSARRFQPVGADRLLEAFRLLDKDNSGYINKDYLGKLMMEAGDPFTKEELDEMMMIACDPHNNAVPYELYINQLLIIVIDVSIRRSRDVFCSSVEYSLILLR